jgi:tetratricopeptide (TPR) repeat protein
VHTLDDSLDTVRHTPAFGDPNASWRALNDSGVSLALEGRWPDALEAFSAALQGAPAFADAPDVHALLHGNRAQAHFHCGEVQAAVESAYRALAARLVCGDTSDAPVARMRADLGVYLAACGESANAEDSLRDALSSLEARFGEHDERLATVLENQARLQLMTQHPDAAEPILLRLHALFDAHAMESTRLTPLFDAVRNAREPELPEASASDDMDVFPIARDQEPSVEPESLLDDAFELLDAADYPPMRSPSAAAIRSAGLVEPGAHPTPQQAPKRTHPLGFEIQYGIPQELLDGDAA